MTFKEIVEGVLKEVSSGTPIEEAFDKALPQKDCKWWPVELCGLANFINIETNKLMFPDAWFEHAMPFINGVARVGSNEKWGIINENGEFVTPMDFDYIYETFNSPLLKVKVDDKYNLMSPQGELLSERWFDSVSDMVDGIARVCDNNKWNCINEQGKLISDTWSNTQLYFFGDMATVNSEDGKCNFINKQGKLVSDEWFDNAYVMRGNKLGAVKQGDKWNIITSEGRMLLTTWVDEVLCQFVDITRIMLDDKFNFVSVDGELLSDIWFDKASEYTEDGFAYVTMNSKENIFIHDENGSRLISDTWFDMIRKIEKGLFGIKLDGKCNFIKSDGKPCSDIWFDEGFVEYGSDLIMVQIKNKFNYLTTNGELISENWFDSQDDINKAMGDVLVERGFCVRDPKGNLLNVKKRKQKK